MVQRGRLETLRPLERPPEDLGERGVGIRRKGARPEPHRRQRGHEAAERRQRSDGVQPVVILGLDHVPAVRAGEVAVVQEQRVCGIDVIPGVPTPARRDDIQPTITV